MDRERLARRFPRLYHMAAFGSWSSIARHGLLSTSALLDLYEIEGAERECIESGWRPASVTIEHPIHGRAVIRDQLPLRPEYLTRCLTDGLTPSDWYRTLNRHVFFWVDDEHLETLLHARAYRAHPQTVLVLDTARLLDRHMADVRLSSINSGSLLRGGAMRGPATFQPVADYSKAYLVELCVVGAVADPVDLVLSAEHRWPDGRRAVLHEPAR